MKQAECGARVVAELRRAGYCRVCCAGASGVTTAAMVAMGLTCFDDSLPWDDAVDDAMIAAILDATLNTSTPKAFRERLRSNGFQVVKT